MRYGTVAIGEICKYITSGGTPRSNIKEYYFPPEVPWLKTKEVNYFRIYETETYISKEGLQKSSAKLIPENSIIVAMYGQGDTAGRVAINKIPLATNQACCNLIIDPQKADYEYVYYAMVTLYEKIVLLKNGGAQPNLNAKIIREIEIPFPDIETQHRIADILSAYDDLIENNKKQIKLLEEAAQRLYKEWFVDLHFPGYENTKIIDGVPEGWTLGKLMDIAEITMGQSPKSEFFNRNKEGLPFHQGVGSYGERFVKNEVYSTDLTRIALSQSILFSVRAPVGRLNITKEKIVIGRGLAAIYHKDGFQSFLFYLLKEYFYKENLIGNGSIFSSITKAELTSLEVMIPNIKLAREFNEFGRKIDDMIQLLDSKIEQLSETRNRLLSKLMNEEVEI